MLRFLQKQPVASTSGSKQSNANNHGPDAKPKPNVTADACDSVIVPEKDDITLEKSMPKQNRDLMNEIGRMKSCGISEDVCSSMTRAADIGGAAVMKELVILARLFLKDWGESARGINTTTTVTENAHANSCNSNVSLERNAKRLRVESQDDTNALNGIVLKQMSAAGKGKLDLVINNDGLAYKFKDNLVQIASEDLEGVVLVPHPHTHKKQTILLLHIRSAAANTVGGVFQHLLITFKDTDKGAVDFGHTTLAAGAIDAAKALVADGRPMKEWVSTLLAHTTRTPSRTITASPFACHKNAAEGFLYLLDGGLLFLTRPLWLPIDDIARIVLCAKGDSEITGGARASFDLEVEMHAESVDKKGKSKKVVHQFMLFRELEPQVLTFIAQVHTTQQQSAGRENADGKNSNADAGEGNADGEAQRAATQGSAAENADKSETGEENADVPGDVSSDESEGEEFDPAAETDDSCAEEYDEEYNSEDGDGDEQDSEMGDDDGQDSEMGDDADSHGAASGAGNARVFDNDDEDMEEDEEE